jgi:hypothetical protein
MQGTSSQQKRCDDVPLLFGILRQIRQLGWERWRIFQESSITRANQNSPTSTKKGGLPRPPQVRRIPVPKDSSIVVYHENFFVGTDT